MAGTTIEQALAENKGALTQTVLRYSTIFKEVVAHANEPGFSEASWAPLAELVATDEFERVGAFKEKMDWKTYIGFITQFAGMAKWNGFFRRVTEVENLVILELEEHNTLNGHTDVSNTVTIYEFNAAGKLRHLDVYLQREQQGERG